MNGSNSHQRSLHVQGPSTATCMTLTIFQNIPIDPNNQAYKQGQLGTCLCSSQIMQPQEKHTQNRGSDTFM
jgi:hypothetical protein